MATETATNKLCISRKVPRSRLWLEGKRLERAGFTAGTEIYTGMMDGNLYIVTTPSLKTLRCDYQLRKVSGYKGRPIIDITGSLILDNFGHGTHVDVKYIPGIIIVSPHKE
jgi:hypothetical protein